MRTWTHPLALPLLIGALALTALPQADPRTVPTVEEPETEVRFPVELEVSYPRPEDAPPVVATHELLGTGVRIKRKFFMDFQVYALGLYLDPSGLPPLREAAGDRSARQLMDQEAFAETLFGGDLAWSLRLVMVRDVDAEDMAEAFDDSVWPLMEAATEAGEERKAARRDLTRFRGFFREEAVEDQVLDFAWGPGGKLHVAVDGRRLGAVESPVLCRALFELYLGAEPLIPEVRGRVYRALHGRLQAPTPGDRGDPEAEPAPKGP